MGRRFFVEDVHPDDPNHSCDGCGAELDRPLGSQVVEEREVWTHEYAYVPALFDPFDPCLIGPAYGLAFGHVFVR